ncbi:protein PUTATIVE RECOMBINATION INITIATION DEFECT 1 isoform X2 [Andrographis paniculata]|uniref:protein PUTATIVE RECOMBINATION INITIATION DEFECT 1 isoform X2 n=1 Tax=Andrographis paniculata TaxID=175694 RepID=UPI0021E6DE21|nr:protein PUTATIVE RECOMBINATION INITIATION DEFECT 1 isoform X2 [Andrographis paniculata]
MSSIIASPATVPPPETCTQGHRSTLILPTAEGGSICLLCLSNLFSNPNSPTVHVSYALSQLSLAASQPQFLHSLLTFHPHFLISPLLAVLSNFEDEPTATQAIDLIQRLCDGSSSNGGCSSQNVRQEFVSRVSDWLSGGSLGWSRRQLFMLHCFGVLLNTQDCDLYTCIKNKDALVSNLVVGLQLSNDEIQGEIMFVLYRSSLLHYKYMDDYGAEDLLLPYCNKFLNVAIDVLLKSQSDEVRINCVAFLTVLARRGFFASMDSLDTNDFMQLTVHEKDGPLVEVLFAEAVKGPLLSSDSQVQIATMDLISIYLSSTDVSGKQCQALLEENIADYIFEILRLSGNKDSIINSSVLVLDLLSNAKQAFRQRLAIGFSTMVLTLRYVAEIPFQTVQCQLLKLILNCVEDCPGVVSPSSAEEISSILLGMFKKNIGMLPEAFSLSCLILVAIMKCSSSCGNSSLAASVIDASRSAVSMCLGSIYADTDQILHSLYLLKEASVFDEEGNFSTSQSVRLRGCIIDILKSQILPWFVMVFNELEEESIALGVIETFQTILLQDSDVDTKSFAEILVSSSWFSILFGCLGLFPTESLKLRVYLIFSSLVDVLVGSDFGQPIRDAALSLPSDPTDLLFLLGQESSHNLELLSCQSAVLLILYLTSLYNDRIADDKLVLASLEQFILLNSSHFFAEASAFVTVELLVNLYGLYRGLAKMSYQMLYSPEAEKRLFQLLGENEWDSFLTKIHLTSLRWLFEQERLWKLLSYQILNFCRRNSSVGNCVVLYHESSGEIDLHVLAELIASGDNFGAKIFVCLLGDLAESASEEFDIISVLKTYAELIEISPTTADQLCIHGIDGVLQNLYNFSKHTLPELFMATSRFAFSILQHAHSESVTNSDTWAGIAFQLMDFLLPVVASDGWTESVLTVIGLLCLILHHSAQGGLTEASKIIVLNVPLISIVNTIIHEACAKGPALSDCDEGTETGEVLMFLLSLVFFSLRSVRASLPGTMILSDEESDTQQLSYVGIQCRDLCKLLHFGSATIKLIASFCLVELFEGISANLSRQADDFNFREGYLLSLSSILEGLIFFDDIRVALNCSRCLSSLMTWKELKIETMFSQDNWCRLIVEELVMSLSTQSLTSKSFRLHQKPALIFAAALLRMSPSWAAKVFNECAVQSIIKNVTPSNVNAELVILFRELLKSGHLSADNVSQLSRVFQVYRQQIYANELKDSCTKNPAECLALNSDYIEQEQHLEELVVHERQYSLVD